MNKIGYCSLDGSPIYNRKDCPKNHQLQIVIDGKIMDYYENVQNKKELFQYHLALARAYLQGKSYDEALIRFLEIEKRLEGDYYDE